VRELTDGEGADVVLDTTPVAQDPWSTPWRSRSPADDHACRHEGVGPHDPGFSSDVVMLKELTIKGMNGQDSGPWSRRFG